ncbi:hypothetical protein LguiA_014132 [Lonicera macranthoides]
MATIHKFKLLAIQCAVRLPRRKTLRVLLRRFPLRCTLPARRGDSPGKGKKIAVRHKLKELFLSSPPIEERISEKLKNDELGFLPEIDCAGGFIGRRSFRQRLVRRHWRPVLVTIPE